jgi:hypothetical protein
LPVEGALEMLLGDEALLEQDLPELLRLSLGCHHVGLRPSVPQCLTIGRVLAPLKQAAETANVGHACASDIASALKSSKDGDLIRSHREARAGA